MQNSVLNQDDVHDTSYYLWIIFFLQLQAGLFLLPYLLWKGFEKRVVQGFLIIEAYCNE